MAVPVLAAILIFVANLHVHGFLNFPVNVDFHPDARNAGFRRPLGVDVNSRQSQRLHPRKKPLFIGADVIQRAHQHIARRAHVAFKVKLSHGFPPK